jgi:hypothetical protein
LATLVVLSLVLVAGWLLIRYVALEQINRYNLGLYKESIGKKAFLYTPARMYWWRVSEPVLIALHEKEFEVVHSMPFLGRRVLPLVQIRKLAMDTFLPWGVPLDGGRLVKITPRKGQPLYFHIKSDIDGWRDWIQSYGFRA